MRTCAISSFSHLDDAITFLEAELFALEYFEPDIKGEVVFIDGEWRVSIITKTRQLEFNYEL